MSQDMEKYPGLLPAFSHLLERLRGSVQFPAERQQSALLPLLPPPTTYYVAIPNYGEPAKQALTIFHEELKDSSVLRDWWQRGDMAKNGPEVEHFIETFSGLPVSRRRNRYQRANYRSCSRPGDFCRSAEARPEGLPAADLEKTFQRTLVPSGDFWMPRNCPPHERN